MIRPQRGLLALALLLLLGAAPARSVDFLTFETGPVRPLATSDDGSRLYSVNTPDNRLEIFDVTDQGLIAAGSLQVGMEPCAVAVAPDGKHPRGLRQGILAETAAWTHILCSTPGAAFNSLA